MSIDKKVQASSMYGTIGGDTDCDSKDYKIGVIGKKNTYGDGAIRYIKDKGRFDLIPEDVVPRICDKLDDLLVSYYCFDYSSETILKTAYEHDFLTAIILLTIKNYFSEVDKAEFDGNVEEHTNVCIDLFVPYFCKMLYDLAKHFQKGAEVYGERNCQKGLPANSFVDSGLRHLGQYLSGVKDDENHFISTIWNFWMYDWTINQKKNVIHPTQFVLNDNDIFPKTEPTKINTSVPKKVNSVVEFYIKANTDEAQAMLKKASNLMAARMSLPMDKLSILFDVLRNNEISVCHEYEDLRYGVGHKCNKFNSPIHLKPTGVYGHKILELYSKLCKDDISHIEDLNNFMRGHNSLLILQFLSELNMSIVFDDNNEGDIGGELIDEINYAFKDCDLCNKLADEVAKVVPILSAEEWSGNLDKLIEHYNSDITETPDKDEKGEIIEV